MGCDIASRPIRPSLCPIRPYPYPIRPSLCPIRPIFNFSLHQTGRSGYQGTRHKKPGMAVPE
jgi:hypothetical protein